MGSNFKSWINIWIIMQWTLELKSEGPKPHSQFSSEMIKASIIKNYLISIEKPEVKFLVIFQEEINSQDHLQLNNYSASKAVLNKINGYFIDYTYILKSINTTVELGVREDTQQNTLTPHFGSDMCFLNIYWVTENSFVQQGLQLYCSHQCMCRSNSEYYRNQQLQ